MGVLFLEVKNYIRFSSAKKSATLSGALVFFVLIGIVPLAYLTSLILTFFGTELTNLTQMFAYPELTIITDYIYDIGLKIGAKGNILVFFVSLYSSGNIFYQLKLSGELIYNHHSKNNIIKRILSVFISFISVWLYSCLIVIFLAIMPIVVNLLGEVASGVIGGLFAFMVVLSMAILINFYTCPYKIKLKDVIIGSLYTAIFTFIMTVLFFIYINNFASYNETYGKIAIIVVFLTWLYLMVKGFIGGITLNVYFANKKRGVCNKT